MSDLPSTTTSNGRGDRGRFAITQAECQRLASPAFQGRAGVLQGEYAAWLLLGVRTRLERLERRVAEAEELTALIEAWPHLPAGVRKMIAGALKLTGKIGTPAEPQNLPRRREQIHG